MTTLLKKAIRHVQHLPASEQDAVAEALFAHIASGSRYRLTPAQAREVRRIRRDLRAGKTRLATEREMAAFWKKYGL